MNRADPRNPAGDGYTPNLVTQNFDVTLIDATGKRVEHARRQLVDGAASRRSATSSATSRSTASGSR